MMFLLHLVHSSAVACISEEIDLGPCRRKDIKGSDVKHKSEGVFFVSWRIQYALNEWPLLDAPTTVYVSLLLPLLYLSTVACIYLEISLGLCWHKDMCFYRNVSKSTYII